MATNTEKPPRRRGRPTREEEMRRTLAEFGVDPATIDPRRVLAAIASDTSAPAGARVQACKVLLGVKDQDGVEETAAGSDALTSRALQILQRRPN